MLVIKTTKKLQFFGGSLFTSAIVRGHVHADEAVVASTSDCRPLASAATATASLH